MSVVGGYDPRILTARRQQILQKVMAQHMQQKAAHPMSGMASLQAATAAQVGGGPQMGVGGGRPNAAHIGVTQGQNLSQSILARLGLTVPRALHGEMSSSPGGAIDRFQGGPFNGAAAMQMLNPYPGDPGAPQMQGVQQAGGIQQAPGSPGGLFGTPGSSIDPSLVGGATNDGYLNGPQAAAAGGQIGQGYVDPGGLLLHDPNDPNAGIQGLAARLLSGGRLFSN